MPDIFYAIPVLLVSCICFYTSWINFKNNNTNLALGLLLFAGLILRIYTASDFFLHTWDERFHALVAKNLLLHPFKPTLYENPILPYDFTNWNGNHIWVHKQPLALWCITVSFKLFGINVIALRLPSILFTTAGIWLTYKIATYFYTNKVGFIAAFLYAINGLIIELTAGRVATDHVDILFLFLIQLAIYLSILSVQKQKGLYCLLTGICIGAAVLTKWLAAGIVFPIWFFIALASKKYTIPKLIGIGLFMGLVSICIFLPWQLFINTHYPIEAKWEASFNYKHFNQVIEQREGTVWYFIDKIRVNYGELIYLPLIWFFWTAIKQKFPLKTIALTIWIAVPILVFSFAQTKMQAYVLFVSPALFMVTAAFFEYVLAIKPKPALNWLRIVILILLLALPVRYAIERIKPFNNTNRSPLWTTQLKALNKLNIKKGVLFNYSNPIEAMFYTNLTVYKEVPTVKVIESLQAKGYAVYFNQTNTLPSYVKQIKGISYLELKTE